MRFSLPPAPFTLYNSSSPPPVSRSPPAGLMAPDQVPADADATAPQLHTSPNEGQTEFAAPIQL